MITSLHEMRVGMSLYWVRLTAELEGWTATWTQNGRVLEVRGHETKSEAILAAKRFAEERQPAAIRA